MEKCPTCGEPLKALPASNALAHCPRCLDTRVRADVQEVPLLAATSVREGPPAELVVRDKVPLPPEFIGRYRILQLLGAGSMATVYLAEDRDKGRQVAIKLLQSARDPSDVARFVREGRLLAELDHPHLVKIENALELEGHPCLVLEYVPGGTLRRKLSSRRPFMPVMALDIMSGILDGLEALHQRGIVHRDLKPENVLFTREGIPKLADLGVARDYGSKEMLTEEGALIGSPLYMAPECLLGAPASIAADIHAAGLLLYELLAGVPPFEASSLPELLTQKSRSKGRPLTELCGSLPSDIVWMVDRALERAPDLRPASAAGFADLVRRARSRLPGVFDAPSPLALARPPPPPPAPRPTVTRPAPRPFGPRDEEEGRQLIRREEEKSAAMRLLAGQHRHMTVGRAVRSGGILALTGVTYLSTGSIGALVCGVALLLMVEAGVASLVLFLDETARVRDASGKRLFRVEVRNGGSRPVRVRADASAAPMGSVLQGGSSTLLSVTSGTSVRITDLKSDALVDLRVITEATTIDVAALD